ncbi:MAG TPA: MFS transporter [Alphaproteobacteria bacterium]|nr:MFS transporter [Alphaproteobacteria bacterium]
MATLPRQVVIPLIVACALFMENLDSTVLATALPAIAQSLGESPLRLSLAITSYLFSLAVFIPASGWVADRFGARRVFRLAILVFLAGSILCGLSSSLLGFVLARIFQGMGGAMMVPVGRLVVLRSLPKTGLINALAYLTVPALVGPVLGPPLGGFITTYVSWRWIFWINVPIGVLGVILATLFIPDMREEAVPPLDLPGFFLTALGLTGLVFGFEAAGRDVVPLPSVISLLAAGAISLALYIRYARRAAHPIIDLSLLRIPTFRISLAGAFLFRVGIGAVPFLLPLMLQEGFGLTPFQSGLLTFASAAGALTMKFTAAPILRRLGFRRVLIVNAVWSGALLALYGLFRADTPAALIFALLLTGGFFRSLQFTSANALVYAEVPHARMSRATSVSAMAQQLSLSIGVGFGALLLHLTMGLRGGAHLVAGDFTPAFFAVGAVAALSALVYRALPTGAGAELARAVPADSRTPPPSGPSRAQPAPGED